MSGPQPRIAPSIVASTAREALEETNVLHLEQDLKTLVNHGKTQGYLTYDEINAYLPDQDVTPEKLDNLLMALDELGIELVDKAPVKDGEEFRGPRLAADTVEPMPKADDLPKLTSDPIRMYLSQMAEIPLLTREQEIGLAKKIEVTRKRFRRSVLSCDYAMRATVAILTQVHKGELPFDRTIKVS